MTPRVQWAASRSGAAGRPSSDEEPGRAEAIWFDLTTSMVWLGGVTGIVRAELELGKHLALRDTRVRFCGLRGGEFVEISRAKLEWLLSADNVIDAYLAEREELRGEWLSPVARKSDVQLILEELDEFPYGWLDRLRSAVVFLVSLLPAAVAERVLAVLLALSAPFGTWRDPAPVRRATTAPAEYSKTVSGPVESPFRPGDTFVSVGWMDTGKEPYLASLKRTVPGLRVVYCIYDTILLNESTSMLYAPASTGKFAAYFSWICRNADLILCGGENTRADVAHATVRLELPRPRLAAIRFGAEPVRSRAMHAESFGYRPDDDTVLRLLRVARPFVLCVGTIEARKNHQILYKAWALLSQAGEREVPLLVIAGSNYGMEDFLDTLHRDPRLRDRYLILQPNDYQLRVLYDHAAFTLLPSLYEGWSLTLPESLSYGKFCLAADVAPLREVGGDLVDYLDPFDAAAWASRVVHYTRDVEALRARERRILATWRPSTWEDSATLVSAALRGRLDA
jgi:glycosyltransferase involved in cell wall biosynthesis